MPLPRLRPSRPRRRAACHFPMPNGMAYWSIIGKPVGRRPDVSAATLAEVRRYLAAPIVLDMLDTERFDYLLRQAYEQGSSEAMDFMEDMDDDMDLSRSAQAMPEPEDLLDSQDDAPIIRLINALLTEAVTENASAIHIEPYAHRLVVRSRVAGVLREVLEPRRVLAPLG